MVAVTGLDPYSRYQTAAVTLHKQRSNSGWKLSRIVLSKEHGTILLKAKTLQPPLDVVSPSYPNSHVQKLRAEII